MQTTGFLRAFWALTKPYWVSEERGKALTLLITVVGLALAEEWMQDQAHYRMQLLDRGTDNPDQRIAEDLRIFVDYTSDLALGLLSAVVTLISFVVILWALSGPLELFGMTIPGYLVWIALVYAIAGTFLTHFIGRRLIGLDFNQQRVEADFRFSLVRLRENSEGVALYRGEHEELGGLH